MATYLITGGAGFIGSHLVETLVGKGEKVRVLDNFATGRWENIQPFASGFEMFEGDCADLSMARKAVAGCDYVLHEAAIPSVPRSVRDPIGSDQANTRGTLTMLEAAREAGVKRFVFAASSAAYGDTPTLPKHEEMPVHPQSPYAVQKVAGEHYCQVFYRTHGLKTVALRYFNVFGPRQDPKSEYAAVVPRFVTAALKNEPVTIYGDGQQSRDFTPVASAVAANLLACTNEKAVGHVINVARGERLTLLELVGQIGEIVGHKVEVRHAEPRTGDVKHSLADITRARTLLGYEPASLDESLRHVVDFYRSAK